MGILRNTILIALSAAALLPAPASAQLSKKRIAELRAESAPLEIAESEIVTLDPSSNWSLDFDDDRCVLQRTFGSGKDQVIALLRRYAPGNQFEMVMVSESLSAPSEKVYVQIEPDEDGLRPRRVTRGEIGGGLYAMTFSSTLSPWSRLGVARLLSKTKPPKWTEDDVRAREEAITGMVFSGGFEKPTRLATGSMAKPMEAIRGCMDTLLQTWGVDPVKYHNIEKQAERKDFSRWTRRIQEIYPRDMVRDEVSADLDVRVVVDEDGRVQSCHAFNARPFPDFEKLACKLISDVARYKPALDSEGEPVITLDRFTITYRI